MLKTAVEKRLTTWIAGGSVAITLLVTDRVSNDPVNVGKMLLLSVLAGGCFSLTCAYYKIAWRLQKPLILGILVFLTTSLVSVLLSDNPWERGFFGTFGRNTGLLTYMSLSIIFLAVTLIRDIRNIRLIISALILAGFANLIYCLVASFGIDIFKWKNPNNSILGTFGNPNFISSFLAIFVTALAGLLGSTLVSKFQKILVSILALLSVYVIKETLSLQGFLVAIAGICIVVFFYIRGSAAKKWFLFSYTGLILIGGLFTLFGTLQKGPLSDLLYKPSVTFRGEYWQAGMNMGANHLFTGVGMDSYGTYYRAFRSSSAAVYPGINVVTDTAHNVFIDIFAGVGVFGLLSYLLIIALVLKTSFKIFREQKSYDPIFVILFASWFDYHLQSIISINQIGLAIWGWVLGGAIIAYGNMGNRQEQLSNFASSIKAKKLKKSKKVSTNAIPLLSASQALSLFAGSVVGFFIGLPPFLSDAKMRQAMESNNPDRVIAQSNAWPKDVSRTNRAIVALANGGLTERARELAIQASIEFPEDYSTWFTLYELSPDGSTEKASFKVKLHSLDPLNPEFAPK